MMGLVALVGCVGIYSTDARSDATQDRIAACQAAAQTKCADAFALCQGEEGCAGAYTTCQQAYLTSCK